MENIYIIEDFYPNPESMREILKKIEYKNDENSHQFNPQYKLNEQGDIYFYPGINSKEILPYSLIEYKISRVKEITGAGNVFPSKIEPRARVSFQGDKSPIRVHMDRNFTCEGLPSNKSVEEWAVVVFLTKDKYCQGGLAFYRSKDLGIASFPLDIDPKMSKAYLKLLYAKILDYREGDWEEYARFEMRFNRGIIFPSHYLHSVYGCQGFGDNFDNCRLLTVGAFLVR